MRIAFLTIARNRRGRTYYGAVVLPSDLYPDVAGWLDEHGCPTSEAAGHLICRDPIAMLRAMGLSPHIPSEDHEVLRAARAFDRAQFADVEDEDDSPLTFEPLTGPGDGDKIREALDRICVHLEHAGVSASPYEGLGVPMGNEIQYGMVLIPNPDELRPFMGEVSRT